MCLFRKLVPYYSILHPEFRREAALQSLTTWVDHYLLDPPASELLQSTYQGKLILNHLKWISRSCRIRHRYTSSAGPATTTQPVTAVSIPAATISKDDVFLPCPLVSQDSIFHRVVGRANDSIVNARIGIFTVNPLHQFDILRSTTRLAQFLLINMIDI